MNIFLLKSAGVIALFLIIYKIFLEHDTYFKGIRVYFIIGVFSSFILPFISITKYIEAPQAQQIVYSQDFLNLVSSNQTTPFNWSAFLLTVYIIGIALSGLYFILQIISLFKILNTKSVKKYNNYKIIETSKEVSPFSFFKYVVYNPSQFSEEEIQQLLKHEETHVLQRHSVDMLLAHTLTCVQWFNPFAWFYKKAITQNLEYIADKEAKFTIAPKNYSYLLLKTMKPNYQMVLANNFYNSLLKKRIMMLHKNHSPRLKQFKLALILPLLVGFVFTFNTKVVAQQKNTTKISIGLINFSIQLDKDGSMDDLKFITKKFKSFGYTIKFNKIKRNSKKELTGIKISAKKGSTHTQYAVNGTTPIKPFKIEYNAKSDQISIATGSDEHNKNRNFFSYKIENYNGDPQKLIKLQNSFIDDKDENNILLINDNDTIHKLKGNNFIVFSDKIKNKDQNTFMTKSKNIIGKVVFIDDDGTKTRIIEVKTDGKSSKSKIAFKVDNDGNIIRVDGKKGNKFIIKEAEDNNDIDASNFNNNTFVSSPSNGDSPLFVVDGKIMKDGFPKKFKPSNIKSMVVLKGVRAINKYGRKGKNGVIEITTKKSDKN